ALRSLLTRYLFRIRNRIRAGKTANTVEAIIRPGLTKLEPSTREAMPVVNVFISLEVTTMLGHRKSLYTARKVMNASVSRMGLMEGITMDQNTRTVEAPSTTAASSSVLG